MTVPSFAEWDLEDLLVASAEEDRAAFAELYERTASKLYAVALRILGDNGKAQDAVHDAYIRIWRSAQSYDSSRGRPITWLATIARNIAIDMRRAARSRAPGGEVELDLALFVGAGGASGEAMAALRVCLDRLDPQQRACVVAAYLDGESREELAERIDRPVGTIKSWLHRSLAQLRTCLGG